jgi:hypothetical protein
MHVYVENGDHEALIVLARSWEPFRHRGADTTA